MKLYWASGSIPSWRVKIVLEEKGLEYESQRLRVMSQPKETKSPEFLAINPRGLTPTFIDDGQVITESMAIIHYLEQFYPNPALIPTNKMEAGRVLARAHESLGVVKAYHGMDLMFKQQNRLTDFERGKLHKAYAQLPKELKFWDDYLSSNPYVAGASFSLADASFYPALAYAYHRGFSLDRLPKLKHYYERLSQRDSIQKSRPFGWHKAGKNLFEKYRSHYPINPSSPDHPH
ncbi:MAG: glutathione S-transferase family protein [Planctomycetota bacterium]|nr:glutathione S-transferase family protein [Planctomycetota bacterium]